MGKVLVVIVIPAFEPTGRLLELLNQLNAEIKQNSWLHAEVLLVDDGSGNEYAPIFRTAQREYRCHLLRHAVNLGKGRALKTAFNYFLNEFPDFDGIVTADSDGQHSAKDIVSCIKAIGEHQDSMILGARNFDDKSIPLKSRFGNKLTRALFSYLIGWRVSDTQTGLRAIPISFLVHLMNVGGERFQYEMNMLLECKKHDISVVEVPIQTIYENGNKGTHFNPFKDSIQIYATFLKYVASALSSFVIDIAFFAMASAMLKPSFATQYILGATIIARVISSLFNYQFNRKIVFRKRQNIEQPLALLRFYLLVAFQMMMSGLLTTFVFQHSLLNEVVSKIIIDTLLFFINFLVQREWVFAYRKGMTR